MKGKNNKGAVARRLKLLLLCDYHPGVASTIIDHIEGLKRYSRHEVNILNFRRDLPPHVDLGVFDGLIIHYSLVACHDSFISPWTRTRIRTFRGLKIAFVQDDYRFINDTCTALHAMRIHALFGLAPPDVIDAVYSPLALPGVRRETVLAGYVPEHLNHRDVRPYEAREIEIGYRARKLPAWLGAHAMEKWVIAERVMADAPRWGLKCDISTREADRIYGEAWIDFLSNCKSVLGTESGSSVCDFTGQIQGAVEAHLERDPDAPFELLRDLYFKEVDGRVNINVISPRCFEAASLRTLMILYEGQYSGRLVPWRHYVPLARDHCNMHEVVAIIRNPERAKAIIDCAYKEVALNPENSFAAMVRFVDRVIDETYRADMMPDRPEYRPELFLEIERTARRRGQIRAHWSRFIAFAVRVLDIALTLLPRRLGLRVRNTLRRFYRAAAAFLTSIDLQLIRSMIRDLTLLQTVVRLSLARNRGRWEIAFLLDLAKLRRWCLILQCVDECACRLVVSADRSALLIYAYDTTDVQPEFGPALTSFDVVRMFESGRVKRVLWAGSGLTGLARSLPFDGEYEFAGLSAMALKYPELVVNEVAHILNAKPVIVPTLRDNLPTAAGSVRS
jgi:hypothetical protein